MILVGIDVAKDKHDCTIMNSNGEVLFSAFTIKNDLDGFDNLYGKILSLSPESDNIKVGLEATGHYSYNLLGYLLDKGLPTFVINPLHTNLYRKSLSLRKTKTDVIDARTIARMLLSDISLKPYSTVAYHNDELKSLTRYRFDKVKQRAKLKSSISRLVNILFPELEKQVSSLHLNAVYALLETYPSAKAIASAHLTTLSHLLYKASKGRFDKAKTLRIRDAARRSIGSSMSAKSMELKHTIHLIRELSAEIDEIETAIQSIMDDLASPILTIPGISYHLGAMIVAEIGDITCFSSPDKLLAYAGMSPTTYQSGQLTSSRAKMEKRGSKYLRYALFNATQYVCHWDSAFSAYLAKKRQEGKHYYVAVSHAAKKLVRVIFHLMKCDEVYSPIY